MSLPLLTGKWKKLILASYQVDPNILKPFIPYGTQLNPYNGQHHVTLMGYLFTGIRTYGLRVPLHDSFAEVNLRFYVVPEQGDASQRGVVYIRQVVGKPLLAWASSVLFKEKYTVRPIHHHCEYCSDDQVISYQWTHNGENQQLRVRAQKSMVPIRRGSQEEFLTWQQHAFTRAGTARTTQYAVQHPLWHLYKIKSADIEVDFEQVFGRPFRHLTYANPDSLLLAEGTGVTISNRIALPTASGPALNENWVLEKPDQFMKPTLNQLRG